jgi:hypothetical protein
MRAWILATLVALGAALGAAWTLAVFGPDPSADVARGSEEPFLAGAWPRELTRDGPQRWAAEEARYTFVDVPAGPARLEVAVRAATGPVTIVIDGVVRAVLPAGAAVLPAQALDVSRGRVEVRLLADGQVRGGRRLGILLERVTLRPSRRAAPSPRLALLLALPALLMLAAARVSRAPAGLAAALAAALAALGALALWPGGLAHSEYAARLALGLAAGVVAAGAFAAWQERRQPGAGGWALAALALALGVQGVGATSPLMVVSDAVFHANKLAAVARGDFYPLSVTQHARPFRFPYGVSFYALLAPAWRAGIDGVALVRGGAALSSLAAGAALFALLRARPARAALAVAVLQLLPVTFDVSSYGNLSNVFAQSATVGFFVWWAGARAGGWLAGALLLALGGLAHLSGLVVLAALALALALAHGRALLGDRTRLLALGFGFGLCALYYAHFVPLVVEQLPRLREGAGAGPHAGAWAALRAQGSWALARWGAPVMLLGALGFPRGRPELHSRDLLAFWGAGLALALAAVVSPLEVRYLYALTLPLAVAAADGTLRLALGGRLGVAPAVGLLAWQTWIAWGVVAEAVLTRYRS